MVKRFRGLRVVGLILKIIGGLELMVGLVCLILLPLVFSNADATLAQFGIQNLLPGASLAIGVGSGLFVFLIGIVCGLLTFAAGSLFNVLIAIEENTRATVILLQSQKQ